MAVHIQTWRSGSATITDLTNAGKRGKKCPQLSFRGWIPGHTSGLTHDAFLAVEASREVLVYLDDVEKDQASLAFDAVVENVRTIVRDAIEKGAAANLVACDIEEIRGVDAPKPVLTAGVQGQWSAAIDKEGVHLSDDADQHNQPAAITYNQSADKAYKIAKGVWDRVQECKTFSEAYSLLSESGCRLHYWCRMD